MMGLGLVLSLAIGASLGFFGGGGSILTVPLLIGVFGLEPKQAIASSLLIVAITSMSGAAQHARRGNLRLRTGLSFGLAGMVGAYLGGRAGELLDGGVLLLLFAGMMVVTAAAMWRGRRVSVSRQEAPGAVLRLAAKGLVVGGFTGLVGAGGGFLVVPALTLWGGLSMQAAVGTSLFVIVLNSLAGFLGYAAHVRVDPVLVASISAAAVVGSFGGAWLAQRIAPDSLRRGFAAFVLAMAGVILVQEAGLLAETLAPALPGSGPQLVLLLVAVAVGALAARRPRPASQSAGTETQLLEGAGI